MKKTLMGLGLAALTPFLLLAGGGDALAQETEEKRRRDYPVTVGKRTILASQADAERQAAARRAPRRTETVKTESRGTFERIGKATVYVPTDRTAPGGMGTAVSAELPKRKTVPSRGRFEQRGKMTIWVPNEKQ